MGLTDSAQPQKLSVSWASVWGTKSIENSKENKCFGRSMRLRDSAQSQNLGLSRASAWGRKIIEKKGKSMVWGVNGAEGQRGIAEFELKKDLSIG